MKLSKQRKVSFGILSIALAALAVDRLYLNASGPASAAAAGAGPQAAEIVATRAPATPTVPVPTLASRLEALAASEDLSPSDVSDLFGEEPVKPWRLTAVLGAGERGSVMIDNQRLAVGETYDGAVLVRVHSDGAVFSRDGGTFEVAMPKPERQADR